MKKILSIFLILLGVTFTGCTPPPVPIDTINFEKPVIHFLGLLPGANCKTQYQLDLFENQTFFIRTVCFKNGVASKSHDDIGRWAQIGSNQIVLRGGRDAPQYFYIRDTKTLELMRSKGQRIDSKLDYTLKASSTAKTLEPRAFMTGMYSYMADAAIFRECITGLKFPVAMEEDNLALERAYLKVRRTPAESLKVHLDAKIVLRDAMEGNKKVPKILVKRFIKIIPKEVCQHLGSEASLENTYWKLTVLNDSPILFTKSQRREAHMILRAGKIQGNSGCNGMGGSYILDGDKLLLSDKGMMSTRMFCKGSRENEFLKALKNMYTYKLKGEYLEIFDKNHKNIARFESVYLY